MPDFSNRLLARFAGQRFSYRWYSDIQLARQGIVLEQNKEPALSGGIHRIFRSSLYQCAGGCLLLIRPLDQTSQESVMLLAEYGTLAARGELAAAVIQEHCPALIEENALERLCTPQ